MRSVPAVVMDRQRAAGGAERALEEARLRAAGWAGAIPV